MLWAGQRAAWAVDPHFLHQVNKLLPFLLWMDIFHNSLCFTTAIAAGSGTNRFFLAHVRLNNHMYLESLSRLCSCLPFNHLLKSFISLDFLVDPLRRLSGGMDSHASSLGLHQLRDKVAEEAVICHSKPASLSSTESSDGAGSSRRIDYLIELDQKNFDKPITSMSNTGDMLNQKIRGSTDAESFMWKQKSEHLENTNSHFVGSITNQSSLVESDVPTGRKAIARAALTSDTCGRRDDQVLTHDPFDSAMNTSSEGCEPSRLQNSVDLESLSQEGYCKALESDGYCKLADVVTDEYQVNCSKEHHERENPEDDRDNDELPGGVFSFFDQG